jgi:hypothetical protein
LSLPPIPIALVFGRGPGPKNVLVQVGDRKVVIAYRKWLQIGRGEARV